MRPKRNFTNNSFVGKPCTDVRSEQRLVVNGVVPINEYDQSKGKLKRMTTCSQRIIRKWSKICSVQNGCLIIRLVRFFCSCVTLICNLEMKLENLISFKQKGLQMKSS